MMQRSRWMESFSDFVYDSARAGHTNIIFEQGMYLLFEDLSRLLDVLKAAGIDFEIIGGVAVNAHLMAASKRSRSFVTRDIDVLIERGDRKPLLAVAESAGYQGKRIVGGYALLLPEQELADAVHLLFVGEKPKSSYPVPNPSLCPEIKDLFGLSIPVAPLKDLLTLQLNSMRPKDLVHLQVLDEAGFITLEIEADLPPLIRLRLAEARTLFGESLDIEA